MLNKVILIGNLGRDPEISYTPSGMAVAKFNIATTTRWKDKKDGEKKERTEWHRITAFDKLGEICGEYLSKGKQVYIEGRIQTSSWEKDGITRYSTDIIATDMKMLGGKNAPETTTHTSGEVPSNDQEPAVPETEDDDIPF